MFEMEIDYARHSKIKYTKFALKFPPIVKNELGNPFRGLSDVICGVK